MNNFFPDATSSWNNVITHFQNVTLYHLFAREKNIFGIHAPTGVGYLFQLRVGLSYHKNVTTLLTPLLMNVSVILVLKVPITSYFSVFFMKPKEQP